MTPERAEELYRQYDELFTYLAGELGVLAERDRQALKWLIYHIHEVCRAGAEKAAMLAGASLQ